MTRRSTLLYTQLFLMLFVAGVSGLAEAAVTLVSPVNGETRAADVCPTAPCTARFPMQIQVTGVALESLAYHISEVGSSGVGITTPVCAPPDPIEQQGDPCPAGTPYTITNETVPLTPGTWELVLRYTPVGGGESSLPPIQLTVTPPSGTFVGPVSLSAVTPISGQTNITARDPAPGSPEVVIPPVFDSPIGPVAGSPTEVEIIGENLHNNPFLRVYLTPISPAEPSIAEDSALPVLDWCMFEADILGAEAIPGGGSKLRVRVPDMPALTPVKCGLSPGPSGHPYLMNWRWVIRDGWSDETLHERVHTHWAIPSPRDNVPWGDAPPFRIEQPPFPDIHGFGFDNTATDATGDEFLTVFGTNAYICVGGFGLCATYIPDPLYFGVWYPIYEAVINSTSGSCNGMASTSQLMWPDISPEPEEFDPNVHFAAGFTERGEADYEFPDFCSPFCSPPRPDSLWANVRMNHGVQFSREFLLELIKTAGEAIFDPDNSNVGTGIPNVTLNKIKDNPLDYVLCFFKVGNGHCVTPYEVIGNRIWIYDNNAPGDETRFIDIVDGDYDYPARADEPNGGNAIVAFPLSIWKEGRNLLSLEELKSIINGVDYLYSLVAGSADMVVTNDDGSRWGWEDDGSFTDSLPDALSIPPLGPQSIPVRQVPLLVPMDAPAPRVEISADGGQYFYHSAQHGHLLQLEVDGVAGEKDTVQMGYSAAGKLSSLRYTPQSATSSLVPRIGLEIGEEESALFHWQGLGIPGGTTAGFGADKDANAVTYSNDTGKPTAGMLMLDHAAGDPERFGRMIYGPFEVPDGADQRVVLENWPDVEQVVSELDFNRDGNADHRQVVSGRPAAMPMDLGSVADLAITKTVDGTTASVGDVLNYTVEISNQGPDMANNITLIDVLPDYVQPANIAASQGACLATATGVDCDFGGLLAGETVVITYSINVNLPGTLANGATIFSNERDPDLTDNSAMVTTDVPVLLDIKPGNLKNVVNPKSKGVIPVAVIGSPGFDVGQIDVSTLKFGSGSAMPVHDAGGHTVDLNGDGVLDLLSHYLVTDSGILSGDLVACLAGRFINGGAFNGCDVLTTVP